jgi:hypothetical protein
LSSAAAPAGLELVTRLGNKLGRYKRADVTLVDNCRAQVAETLSARVPARLRNYATLVSGVLIGLSEAFEHREGRRNSNTIALDLKSGARR